MVAAKKKPAKKATARKPKLAPGATATAEPPKRGKEASKLTLAIRKHLDDAKEVGNLEVTVADLEAVAEIKKLGGTAKNITPVRQKWRGDNGLVKTRAKKAKKVKPLKVSRVRIIENGKPHSGDGVLDSGLALLRAAGSFAAARKAIDSLEEIRSITL